MARGGRRGSWTSGRGGAGLPLTDVTYPPSGGGGSAPAWVPAEAKTHIDFVGGSPQGRAWSNGAEVAVDTLLGSDPNTSNGWGDTAYDPAGLLPQGYSCGDIAVAFIGVARTALVGNATMTMRYLQIVTEATASVVPLGLLSEDGLDGVTARLETSPPAAVMEDYNGNFEETLANIPNVAINAINVAALTIAASRFEFALNGGVAVAGVLDAVSRPPGNPLVAALAVSTDEVVMQSITIYDPLPDTTGLSELSEI